MACAIGGLLLADACAETDPIGRAAAETAAPAAADTAVPPRSDGTENVPSTIQEPTTAGPTTTAPTAATTATDAAVPSTTTGQSTTSAPTNRELVAAVDILAQLTIENEQPAGYRRDLFDYPSDADGDGCDTRAEVLIRTSRTPAQIDPFRCHVVAGDWRSPYDGITWTDPAAIEIDHVVALKEAWDSGAWAWDPARLAAFGNDLEDPRTLRPVTAAINSSKGNADPSNWIPPDDAVVCEYLGDWLAIKARWALSMDESEHGRIRNLLTQRCPGQLVAPWPTAPPSSPGAPSQPPIVSSVPDDAVPPVAPQQPSGASCDPSYPSLCIAPPPPDLDCRDIPHRRFPVLPPDPHRFDLGDSDGIGCER